MEGLKEIEFQRLVFHKLNRVLWTQFPLNQIESNKLDFWVNVDTLSTLATGKMEKSSTMYSIYNPKIDSK